MLQLYYISLNAQRENKKRKTKTFRDIEKQTPRMRRQQNWERTGAWNTLDRQQCAELEPIV